MRLIVLVLLMIMGCGDGVLIISVNTGTIVSNPSCGNGSGHFDLQNQAGLLLGVVIGSDTVILNSDGHRSQCTDLTQGAHVNVTGPQQGTQINARSVTLQ